MSENPQSKPSTGNETKKQKSIGQVFREAGQSALKGGIAGAAAMTVQVCSLMWMRTTMNYQYRYGKSTTEALRILYNEGGVRRFYRGIGPALLQGPLSRFGDTAANNGALTLLEDVNINVTLKTLVASGAAATFRIALMPIDALKTTLQVEGANGLKTLSLKLKNGGPTVLWHGSLGAMTATFVGHYPWFATYNFLNSIIPIYDETHKKLMRSAFIGFVSSVVSDTISNSLRVVKTYRQTSPTTISYKDSVKDIVQKEGYAGLFGRGLKTRIITNGLQGLMFSVMWRLIQDKLNQKKD